MTGRFTPNTDRSTSVFQRIFASVKTFNSRKVQPKQERNYSHFVTFITSCNKLVKGAYVFLVWLEKYEWNAEQVRETQLLAEREHFRKL